MSILLIFHLLKHAHGQLHCCPARNGDGRGGPPAGSRDRDVVIACKDARRERAAAVGRTA